MNKKTTIVAAIAFIAGLLITPVTVSAAQRVFDVTIKVGSGDNGYEVTRFDDTDFQVKCWAARQGYKGGISCLPWSEVKER